MTEGILAVVVLGLIAGGAIVVIDTLILRRVRRQGPPPVHPSVPDLADSDREQER